MKFDSAALGHVLRMPLGDGGDGGGGAAASARPAEAAADADDEWPSASTLERIEGMLSPEDFAEVMGDFDPELDECDRIGTLARKIFAVSGERFHELIMELYSTYPYAAVAYFVIILVRTSPDEWVIVEASSRSQLKRILDCEDMWREELAGSGVQLMPFYSYVIGKGIDAYKTLESDDEMFRDICDHVRALLPLGKPVKIIASDYDRFARIPADAVTMVQHIEGLGDRVGDVEVKAAKCWDCTVEEVREAWEEHKREQERINEVATHVDPAKGLRINLPEEDLAVQNAVDRRCEAALPGLAREGSTEHGWLASAVSEGTRITTTAMTPAEKREIMQLIDRVRGVTADDSTDETVAAIAEKEADDYWDLVLGRRSDDEEPPEQNTNLIVNRNSRSAPRKYVTVNGQKVGEHQAAMAYAYLREAGLLTEDSTSTEDDITTAILVSNTQRWVKYNDMWGDIIYLVVYKRCVKRLIMSTTTRLSQFEGIVVAIIELCEKAGVEVVLTECMGTGEGGSIATANLLSPRAVAKGAQTYWEDMTANRESYKAATEQTSQLGEDMRKIACSRGWGTIDLD